MGYCVCMSCASVSLLDTVCVCVCVMGNVSSVSMCTRASGWKRRKGTCVCVSVHALGQGRGWS